MLLLGDQHLLVVLVRNPEGLPLTLDPHQVLEVGTRRRVLFHVALHPVRELLLPPETKTSTLQRTRLEASVQAVGRLARVLGIAVEPVGLGDAVDQDGLLESAGALLIEDACMGGDVRSP